MKTLCLLILTLSTFTFTTAFADSYQKMPDFKNPSEMANFYENQIKERERENAEKWREIEQRSRENEIRDELRYQRRQYGIDRMIDENR